MFSKFKTDKVTLIKEDGQKYEDIFANVQPNLIFIDDATLPIEEGDKLIRVLPNSLKEVYVVMDRGLYSGIGGIKAHYQVKVRKEKGLSNIDGHANINNFYGNVNNAQIQQNVKNSSQTISLNEDYDKKDELENYILMLKENLDKIGGQPEKMADITKNIDVIELELKQQHSKPKVINECLGTIRNVLEGVTGSLIASGLIYQLGVFVK